VITRSGVFSYTDSTGKTIQEWRPPEEVLATDAMASLTDLPVTDRHPKGFVTPETWSTVAIGHVSGQARKSDAVDGAVESDLVVARRDAIDRIGKPDGLLEISQGYNVRIDETPGVVPAGMPDAGKRYDAVQRDIRANHVALGPKGWGRQGPAVAMRLDSAGDEVPPACCADCATHTDAKMCDCGTAMQDGAKYCMSCGKARADAAFPWDDCMAKAMKEYGNAETAKKVCGAIKAKNESKDWRGDALDSAVRAERENQMIKIRVDGKEIVFNSDAEAQAYVDGLHGKVAGLTTELASANKRADEAPAAAIAAMRARTELEASARTVLGADVAFTRKDSNGADVALTDRELRIATIQKRNAAFKADGKSDDFVLGVFETVIAGAGRPTVDSGTESILLGLAGVGPEGKPHVDSAERADANEPNSDKARERQLGRLQGKKTAAA